jgi:predicted glycosyltransferase
MAKPSAQRQRRIFFDLNHPADFNLFRGLILKLREEGYRVRITARNKDRLHQLLRAEGIPFRGRGSGSRFLAGKYILGAFLIALTFLRVLLFRPGLTISLNSPYLIIASRILRIPSICFNDNDTDLRLHPFIKIATYIFTPSSYPIVFHRLHFRIPIFKEMAYLPDPLRPEQRDGIFLRVTCTDTTHHSRRDALDLPVLRSYIESFSDRFDVFLSSEKVLPEGLNGSVNEPGPEGFHEVLNRCRVFWGNSATMAAEAALLGIPSVYVSAEISSCLRELKDAGLLFHFMPNQLESSLQKAEELMESRRSCGEYCVLANWIRKSKIDMGAFLYWVVTNFPDSVDKLLHDPDWMREIGEPED